MFYRPQGWYVILAAGCGECDLLQSKSPRRAENNLAIKSRASFPSIFAAVRFWLFERYSKSSALAVSAVFSSITDSSLDWSPRASTSSCVTLSLWSDRLVSTALTVKAWVAKVDWNDPTKELEGAIQERCEFASHTFPQLFKLLQKFHLPCCYKLGLILGLSSRLTAYFYCFAHSASHSELHWASLTMKVYIFVLKDLCLQQKLMDIVAESDRQSKEVRWINYRSVQEQQCDVLFQIATATCMMWIIWKYDLTALARLFWYYGHWYSVVWLL